MTNKRPLGLPPARLIVIAAVAGLIAGAVAVYVRTAGSGNANVAGTEVAAAGGACEGTAELARRVDELARGEVAAMTPVEPPRPVALSFKGPEGQDLQTGDLQGKTVLLNLWATWCGPCREEMPALNTLQKDMGSEDFEVVAVNIDTGSDEKPKAFLAETGVDALGYYRDSSMGVFNALKKEGLAFGLPVTLLLDRNGCLMSAMNGPAAWDSPDAKAMIAAAKGS
ncbi:thiol:disulfide interchange protein TlpA [Pseudorhizobium pelagicum]|uniref:Sodium:dicarboxylate symporter n=1 Tax=Pseudorhizobium pelagicum TaxID=1509405 RepID=A0A922P2G6_9HYPH|nr:TlpA disulfide reductase family protein [Pseudorhizobium pelagicum]KEQ07189.1 sodium:dicarboxylate symporter [Pseudorhizobium pelagicum]KEQ10134.1 sodium:dicarboxylate symporter [Pseudorhizobium pelagicum]